MFYEKMQSEQEKMIIFNSSLKYQLTYVILLFRAIFFIHFTNAAVFMGRNKAGRLWFWYQ